MKTIRLNIVKIAGASLCFFLFAKPSFAQVETKIGTSTIQTPALTQSSVFSKNSPVAVSGSNKMALVIDSASNGNGQKEGTMKTDFIKPQAISNTKNK